MSFRWSFSQWETYNQCPQKWKFKSRDRLPTAGPGPAAERGLEIHNSIENYINGGDVYGLHPAIKPDYKDIFDQFRDHPNGDRWTERAVGFTREWVWAPAKSEYTYVMMVFDAMRFTKFDANSTGIVEIGEWKSGKPKDTHRDQRSLYALGAIRWYHADEAIVTTHYVEGTEVSKRLRVTRDGADKLQTIWMQRAEQMERDKICAPRPNFGCKWCDFAQSKGGPCKFG